MKQIAYVLIGVLAGFILAGGVFVVTRLPSGKPIALEPSPTKVPIAVQVVGGVVRPGVYELPEGSRVQDAVDAAGGLLADVDASAVNMAEKLQDGQQVQIPGGAPASASSNGPANSNNAPFQIVPTAASAPTSSGDQIDINTASVTDFESLPGIGPTTAQSIVDYRNAHGPFSTIEDIMNVPGIGPSTFDQIRALITVSMP